MKYFYIILFCVAFTLSSQVAVAAEGGLVWSKPYNYGNYNDRLMGVATDDTAIYEVGVVDLNPAPSEGQWTVIKRNKITGEPVWVKIVNLSICCHDAAWGVAVDDTGVYIVGEKAVANRQWHMEKRSLVDGSLIWSQEDSFTNNGAIAKNVKVDSTGVYITGYERITASDYQWRIQKRNLATGTLIWNQFSNPSVSSEEAINLTVDGTGVYVVGLDGSLGSWQMRIEKRNLSTGALIWEQVSNPTPDQDISTGVAVNGTGVYVAGYNRNLIGGDNFWLFEKRNLFDGTLIWSQSSDPSTYQKFVKDISINNHGFYVSGFKLTSDREWLLEKRNLSTGALIFSEISNYSTTIVDDPTDIEVDSSGIYVVGNENSLGSETVYNTQWRIEKREVVPPALPDLTAGPVSPSSAVVGSATTFSSVISNTGTAGTGTSFNNLYQFDSNSDHTVVDGTRTVTAGPLTVSGTENTSASYTFPSAGTWYVRACADSGGSIIESNEGNNCGVSWTVVTVLDVPSGTITPADCIITSGTTCTASIGWTTSNVASPNIRNNGVTFSTLSSSAGTPATLNYGLNMLNLYDGTNSLAEAFAFGIASDQGTGGPSCGGSFTSAPTTGLCASGTVSSVVPTGTGWGWTCGTGVGEVACTATNIGSVCPNTICESTETMLSCPQDCGAKKLEQF